MSMLLWMGEQKRPLKVDRKTDLVMDSVINYYNDEKPRLAYDPKKLFLDNGAFTANMQGISLQAQRVMDVQEALMPDRTIPLDYPSKAGMSTLQMMKRWQKTRFNIVRWQDSTRLGKKLVPALHAWSKMSLEKNIKWLQRYANSDFIALGSIVTSRFTEFGGFFGDRTPTRDLIDMLSLAIKCVQENSDFKVHLMGFGSSPLMLHLGHYLGVVSTDSSGYRRKAAYGKIILPGMGERYVGDSSATFGYQRNFFDGQRESDLSMWEKCGCPVCITNKDLIMTDWKARAIHNEFVMKEEAKVAQALTSAGLQAYETYLNNQVFANSSLKFIWEYAKLRRKYLRISEVLFR
jgi:7-cyano-7-deazaguanine tRNA-ribosyltransferase